MLKKQWKASIEKKRGEKHDMRNLGGLPRSGLVHEKETLTY
jgi:hypothetical protein